MCNDAGFWGRGFVTAISRRWPEPKTAYRAWSRTGDGFTLGAVQLVQVADELWVANMVAQHGIRTAAGLRTAEGVRRGDHSAPIRYAALQQCLTALAEAAAARQASVHAPRIGAGLAGGEWERIKPLIITCLVERGVAVSVYDLDPAAARP
ncbi:Appr-1-p processing protein [Planobispora rosea]|uniref:Appr-1-p processing protein n=1 Tax=Planobispora rosea TaxID=35762 RepID=A0A8J3SDY0_PLARO|nr:Appr-1-p processing protein [Planobispora rosea]GGS98750.1 Appr-1-p processing protein [Planobispora rosea]GIH87973.1 Appr-1-p processing protein [Planobispora rosea]